MPALIVEQVENRTKCGFNIYLLSRNFTCEIMIFYALPFYGCVISSGLTNSSNFSPSKIPNSIADSRREVPFL